MFLKSEILMFKSLFQGYSHYMSSIGVQEFYEDFGWAHVGSDTNDALLNENLSEVARVYTRKVRLRVKENIGSGFNMLDVGSGPIQYEEYLAYSDNFQKRICVDLSKRALVEAERKLGRRGVYLQGDYLQMSELHAKPLDGATLINVLYHVEKDLQEVMVNRILGSLNRGSRLVVVYSNPWSFSSIMTRFALLVRRNFARYLGRAKKVSQNPIYFYRHNLKFWNRFNNVANVQLKAWRSFDPSIEKIIFREKVFGEFLLEKLFKLEEYKFWARIAEYQLIVLEKK